MHVVGSIEWSIYDIWCVELELCIYRLVTLYLLFFQLFVLIFFFFQAEDGIRDLVRSRGLGDVYKRQAPSYCIRCLLHDFSSYSALLGNQ